MPQFKPTQRKNGAIVLTMHKNLGPPPLQQEDSSQSSQQTPQCNRKRQHSSYTPAAKASGKKAGSRKH
ncbi:hypothetical protein TWF730_001643 [Orbilia blumenaviensis]|uniref:Uncharacterized protein n=1 Tax=Orbilia blumenaviensis TaxID=1796055 RepID=A0AAV9ULY0_9PEZI